MNSRKTVVMMIGQLCVLVLNVVALKVTLLSLPPKDYGLYGYALSLTGLFMAFSELNMSSVYLKRIAEGQSMQQHYSTYVMIRIFLILIAALTFVCYSVVTGASFLVQINQQTSVFAVTLSYYLLDAVMLAAMGAYQARREVYRTQFVSGVMAFVNLVFIAGVVWTTKNVLFLSVALVIKPIVGILCFIWMMKGELNLFKFKIDRSIAGDYIKFTTSLLPLSVIGVIYEKTDGIMITRFLSFTDNGYFTAATMFNVLLLLPSTAIMTLLFSLYAEEIHNGKLENIGILSRRATKYLSLAVTPVAMFFLAHADSIVILAMSKDYLPAVPIMRIFMLQVVFMTVSRTIDPIFLALEKFKLVNMLGITLFAGGIVINFVLIPDNFAGITMMGLGALGPAVKALLFYTVYVTVSAVFLKKIVNIIIYWRFLIHLAVASFLALLVMKFAPQQIGIVGLSVSFLAYCISYFCVLFLVRELKMSDISYLLKSLQIWRLNSTGDGK